jgi:hypothetical protein
MSADGYRSDRRSSRLVAQWFRGATPEERATYRKWRRAAIIFYLALFLILGAVGAMNYSGVGLTQLANLAARQIVQSPRSN